MGAATARQPKAQCHQPSTADDVSASHTLRHARWGGLWPSQCDALWPAPVATPVGGPRHVPRAVPRAGPNSEQRFAASRESRVLVVHAGSLLVATKKMRNGLRDSRAT